jgi:hypothetical protein
VGQPGIRNSRSKTGRVKIALDHLSRIPHRFDAGDGRVQQIASIRGTYFILEHPPLAAYRKSHCSRGFLPRFPEAR